MKLAPIETITTGEVIRGGPDRVSCRVLRIDHGTETVAPLAGRACIRLWCRATIDGTEREGYVTFGPGGMVERA